MNGEENKYLKEKEKYTNNYKIFFSIADYDKKQTMTIDNRDDDLQAKNKYNFSIILLAKKKMKSTKKERELLLIRIYVIQQQQK